MNERFRAPQVRRAVVLFPSGLTLANLFFGVILVVSNLIVDVLYGVVDPRIRLS